MLVSGHNPTILGNTISVRSKRAFREQFTMLLRFQHAGNHVNFHRAKKEDTNVHKNPWKKPWKV